MPAAVYGTLNERVVDAVPVTAQRILDVGCGTGWLGKYLKERQPCYVAGITNSGEEARAARAWLDEVHEVDLEQFSGLGDGAGFDVLVLSHVLEHIRNPEVLLPRMLKCATNGATVVVALPNVLHWKQRLEFLRGNFRYEDAGLMDRTHVRFFDRVEALRLLRESGLTVENCSTSGGWPGSRLLGPIKTSMDRLAVNSFPGLFGGEFLFVCRCR